MSRSNLSTVREQRQQQGGEVDPPFDGSGFEAHQQRLPRLPVPSLQDTLRRYLERVRMLLSDGEYMQTELAVRAFAETEGPLLQERLLSYSKDRDSYVEEFWDESYLTTDASVVLNLNPFFVLEDDPTPSRNSQVARATGLVLSSLKFVAALRQGTIEPDEWRGKPLCMAQYSRLFGSARVPGTQIGRDQITTARESRHIVVMRRGQLYWFDVLSQHATVGITERQISRNLQTILSDADSLSDSDALATSLGVLTTEARGSWASSRDELVMVSDSNAAMLEVVDSALFVLCLDTESPATPSAAAANMLRGSYDLMEGGVQRGSCANRWYDKLQIIVCANGVAGVNFEHSAVDGHTVLRFVSDVFTDTIIHFAQSIRSVSNIFATAANPTEGPHQDQRGVLPPPQLTPHKLEFGLTPELRRCVARAESKLSDLVSQNETEVLEYRGYGKRFITQNKMSPDAFVQIAFQLAYHSLYFETVSQYEPVQTKAFLHGRTEACRAASPQCLAFIHAFEDKSLDATAKVGALRVALQAHIAQIKECAQGLGCERHLFALRSLWTKNNSERVERDRLLSIQAMSHVTNRITNPDQHPEDHTEHSRPSVPKLPHLFRDAGWAALNHTVLSTSNCGNPSLRLFGFGPVVPDGFGIGYVIKAEGLQFCAASKHRQTKRYLFALRGVLDKLQDILVEAEGSVSQSVSASCSTTDDATTGSKASEAPRSLGRRLDR